MAERKADHWLTKKKIRDFKALYKADHNHELCEHGGVALPDCNAQMKAAHDEAAFYVMRPHLVEARLKADPNNTQFTCFLPYGVPSAKGSGDDDEFIQ